MNSNEKHFLPVLTFALALCDSFRLAFKVLFTGDTLAGVVNHLEAIEGYLRDAKNVL